MERARPRCIVVAILFLCSTLTWAQADPELSATVGPGPKYKHPLAWIGPVYFHWHGMNKNGTPTGLYFSPWLPLEGRAKWDGSVAHHKKHDRYLINAGFNLILFEDPKGWRWSQKNHLQSLKELKANGKKVPKVAPFFAAESFKKFHRHKNFNRARDFNTFYGIVESWFKMFFKVMGRNDLAWYQDKVLIAMWNVESGFHEAPPDFFQQMNSRLQRDFGFEAYWTVAPSWSDHGPDEINHLFWGREDVVHFNTLRNVDIRAGFWPLRNVDPELFQARDGGELYKEAWKQVVSKASRECGGKANPSLVLIESYNEYQEASGIYPAQCMKYPNKKAYVGKPDRKTCLDRPCISHKFKDKWANSCSNKRAPFRYLDISKSMIKELNRKLASSGGGDCGSS